MPASCGEAYFALANEMAAFVWTPVLPEATLVGAVSAQGGRLRARHVPLHAHLDAPALGPDRPPRLVERGQECYGEKSLSPLIDAARPVPPTRGGTPNPQVTADRQGSRARGQVRPI
jgi:hypothetical protein